MRRRKQVMQEMDRDLPTLEEEHEIVRVVEPRGGNIVEVERQDGSRTLCSMPKKFNKTLWVKRDGYLLIERADGVPPPHASTTGASIPSASPACTDAQPDATPSSAPLPEATVEGQQCSTTATREGDGSYGGGGRENGGLPSSSTPAEAAAAAAISTITTTAATGTAATAAAGIAAARPAGATALKSSQAQPPAHSKVAGTIVAVLYDEQIKQLKKMPGVWPPEFEDQQKGHPMANQDDQVQGSGREYARKVADDSSSGADSEEGLPPLQRNTNRRVAANFHGSDEEEDSEEEES